MKSVFDKVAQLSIKYSKSTLLISFLLAIVSLFYAQAKLSFDTNQDSLISKKQGYFVEYLDFLKEFGDWEYIYVVLDLEQTLRNQKITNPTLDQTLQFRNEARTTVDKIAELAGKHPNLFQSIEYKINPKLITDQLLLLAPQSDFDAVLTEAEKNTNSISEFLGINNSAQFYDFISSQLMKLESSENNQQMERYAPIFMSALFAPFEKNELRQFISFDPLELASDFKIDPQGYFFSENGKLMFMKLMPTKNFSSMEIVSEPLAALRDILQNIRKSNPDLVLGVTGRPVLQNDEAKSTQSDSEWAGIVSFLLVALLVLFYFRSFKRSLFVLLGLCVSTCWTIGFITLVFGTINLITIVFTIILIGLGIDYGIHYLIGYQHLRLNGADTAEAIRNTTAHTGKGIFLGALTSSVAFLTCIFTDFLGLQQLGIIAGVGILFCCIAQIVMFPAMLNLFDTKSVPLQSLQVPSFSLFDFSVKKPRPVMLILGFITVAGIWALTKVEFNHNLLDLQDPKLESVRFENLIQNKSDHSTWFLAQKFSSLKDLNDARTKIQKLPSVKTTASILDILPYDSDLRQKQLQQLSQKISNTTISHSNNKSLKDTVSNLAQQIGKLGNKAFSAGMEDEFAELNKIRTRLNKHVQSIEQASLTQAPNESEFMIQLNSIQNTIRNILAPHPVSEQNLDQTLLSMYKSSKGNYSLSIFPKDNIWDDLKMQNFITDVRQIAPNITGAPITHFESAKRMVSGFSLVAGLTSLIVLILMFLEFRRWQIAFIIFSNLLIGMTWLALFMWLTDLSINLANFFAIPVLIGSGVDQGIHVMHRYLHTRSIEDLFRTVIPAIGLSCLTTIFGFAALSFVSHRGLASFGLIMTAGSTFTFLSASILLPATLSLWNIRSK